MPDKERAVQNLAREIDRALDGLTPIEKALRIAASLRAIYGTEWAVDARADGSFSITEWLPDTE